MHPGAVCAQYSFSHTYTRYIVDVRERIGYKNLQRYTLSCGRATKDHARYFHIKEYPTEAEMDDKLDSIDDLVFATISPMMRDFIRKTPREGIQLL